MSWSMLWGPVAVVALASLIGWAVARWLARPLALGLVLLLVLAALVLVVLAALNDGIDGMAYAVWATMVILPAAIGTAIGAMLAMRAAR